MAFFVCLNYKNKYTKWINNEWVHLTEIPIMPIVPARKHAPTGEKYCKRESNSPNRCYWFLGQFPPTWTP